VLPRGTLKHALEGFEWVRPRGTLKHALEGEYQEELQMCRASDSIAVRASIHLGVDRDC